MFGGARLIVVDRAGDESSGAAANVLALATAGNPVVLLAGDLKKSVGPAEAGRGQRARRRRRAAIRSMSATPKRWSASRRRALGLRPAAGVAARIAAAAAAIAASSRRELEKYAAFLDAAPDAPKPLEHEAVDAIGADVGEGDLSRLLAAVAGGDPDQAETELARLRAEGKDGIQLIRAALRRMTMLARLRAEVERGKSVGAVMASAGKSIFFKEQGAVQAELGRWRGGDSGQGDLAPDRGRARRSCWPAGRARSCRRGGAARHRPPGGAATLTLVQTSRRSGAGRSCRAGRGWYSSASPARPSGCI